MSKVEITLPAALAERVQQEALRSGQLQEDVLLAAVMAANKAFSDLGLAYAQMEEDRPLSTKALLAFDQALTSAKEWLDLAKDALIRFQQETRGTIPATHQAFKKFLDAYKAIEGIYDTMASQILNVKEPAGESL